MKASRSGCSPACTNPRCRDGTSKLGFLGTARGAVEKFNLQSGHRRAATAADDAHSGSVRGLATEALAQLLFSAGHDGELRVWRARDLAAEWTLSLEAPVFVALKVGSVARMFP